MNRKLKLFLEQRYTPQSYFYVLRRFLRYKLKDCSVFTLERIYYNLHPIGKEADNPPIGSMDRSWLHSYVDNCKRRYAPETMRTLIGDVRMFFKWAKKKGFHKKNLAKRISPVDTSRHRRRRPSKAAPEADSKRLMRYLANCLRESGLVYQDVFGDLQGVEPERWTYEGQKVLRDLFITTFLYETGARGGEMSSLGTVTMNQVTNEPLQAYIITLYGKEGNRNYLFTNQTAQLWRIWCRVRPPASSEYAVIGWGNGHPPGRFLTNGISNMLVRRCKEVGVRPFRSHALRHAKVKRARKLVGLEMASMLVDHSDITTTRNYANIDAEELIAAAVLTGVKFDIWG